MRLAGSALPALLIAVAAIAFAIVTIYMRARAIENYTAVPTWPQGLGYDNGAPCDWTARVDVIERLAIIGEPWCLDALRTASTEERDPRVRKAIEHALKSLS